MLHNLWVWLGGAEQERTRVRFRGVERPEPAGSFPPKKDTPIAGLRMFVAFLVFAKAPAK